MTKKLAIVAVIAVLVGVYFGFDLQRYLSVGPLQAWVQDSPLEAGIAFFVLYLLVASLSLPGAGALSIIAGIVFGLGYGVLIVSFASSIGATVAMLISRALLQDWVRAKFSKPLKKIDRGMEKDGLLYLFTVRLVPPIPFFVINLVYGLTKTKWYLFYIVSQIGMFPATVIYINAGARLGEVEKVTFAEVFQPEIILSFAALIAFPFLVKFIMNKFKANPKEV